jgi:thioredoxin 2
MKTLTSSVVQCEHCGAKNRVPAAASGVPRCGKCHNPLPWITDADDDTFAEVVEQADIPVIVDMWAAWCGPCRMVTPALEKVAKEMAGRVKLVKVDVDKSPKTAQRFTVQAVPTLILMRGGQVIARQAGAAPAAALRKWAEDALAKAGEGAR